MTSRTLQAVCAALCLALAAVSATAKEKAAAAMVMRIEPADTGIARVLRNGESEEVAFMMALYPGDELVVESPNTSVQVRFFGGDDVIARHGQPLTIETGAAERSLFGNMLSALSDKVFRNNQLSRRNLVTRSDGESPLLELFGFGADGPPQQVLAGQRSLLLFWNLDLDAVNYRIEDVAGGRAVAGGTAEGDFAFIESAALESGRAYTVVVESAAGGTASGRLIAVDSLPGLTPVSDELGTIGAALSLLELAQSDGGAWKFEAIQGVLELSPDDIDRATLIGEISSL